MWTRRLRASSVVKCLLLSACREPFWPEQQCRVETPEPATGRARERDAHVPEMCVMLMCTSVSSHRIFLHLVHMACGEQGSEFCCSRRPFIPVLIDCTVLPLPLLSSRASFLCRPLSNHIFILPRVSVSPWVCVFVALCHVSRSPPVLSSLILCSSRSCLSSPLSKVSRPLPALSSRGRR